MMFSLYIACLIRLFGFGPVAQSVADNPHLNPGLICLCLMGIMIVLLLWRGPRKEPPPTNT